MHLIGQGLAVGGDYHASDQLLHYFSEGGRERRREGGREGGREGVKEGNGYR